MRRILSNAKKIFIFLSIMIICSFSSFTFGGNITIYNPAAGVSWLSGTLNTITWEDDITQHVSIELIGSSGTYTITSDTESDGSYDWTIDPTTLSSIGTLPGSYKIKITSVYNSLTTRTSEPFTITNANPNNIITILSPAAGVTWLRGTIQNITWWDNITGNVKIELCNASGIPIGPSYSDVVPESNRTYAWTIQNNLLGDYKMKISSVNWPSVNVTSEIFKVTNVDPTSIITIYNPAVGVKWLKGSTQTITWTDNISGNVNLELLKSDGTSNGMITTNLAGNSYSWTIGDVSWTYPKDFKIKIISVDNSEINVTSGIFKVINTDPNSYITMYSPAWGIEWLNGESHNITWEDNISGPVSIKLLKADGTDMNLIVASTPSNGTYPWTPSVAKGNYKIKITSIDNSEIYAINEFKLINLNPNSYITLRSPAAGVKWLKGTLNSVSWEDNITGNIDIDLLTSSGSYVGWIAQNIPSSNLTHSWNILNAAGEYKIKITSKDNSEINVTSDIFTITDYELNSIITIYNPALGVSWLKGSTQNITWWDNITGNVKIEVLNSNGIPTGYQDVVSESNRTYAWTIQNDLGGDYKMKISSVDHPSINVTSGIFKVIAYDPNSIITLLSPAEGVTWVKNTLNNVTWYDNISGLVDIDLYRANDSYVGWIAQDVASNGTHPWTIINEPGDYKIKITSIDNPLVNAIGNFKIILDGKKSSDGDVKFAVNIYPNPVIDKLNITSDQTMNHIWVMNNLGRVVIETSLNSNQSQIDVSKLNTGIYFIKIKTNDSIITNKISIQ